MWNLERTASLRGNRGRNAGWDFVVERMNFEVAEQIGSNISPEHIPDKILQLNGIRQVRERAFSAFGVGDDGATSEYGGILDCDVRAVCHHLKTALGFNGDDDANKLSAPKSNNFRSDGSVAPWTRVSAAVAHESTSDYIDRMVRSAPRNNMLYIFIKQLFVVKCSFFVNFGLTSCGWSQDSAF